MNGSFVVEGCCSFPLNTEHDLCSISKARIAIVSSLVETGERVSGSGLWTTCKMGRWMGCFL